MKEIICPYCNQPAIWCENKEIYGKNYGRSYMVYYCKKCNAYVGCHNNTTKPLGTLANKELRGWRQKAHIAIDNYWKINICSRDKIYRILKELFKKEVHIGSSDIEMCKAIIKATDDVIPKLLKNRRW